MHDEKNILLKSVEELLGMNFFIPDYQRGYRWKPQQAEDLLNDILAFYNRQNSSSKKSEIYCIQPLVVKRREKDAELLSKIKNAKTISDVEQLLKDSWDVVDGQQRLTTIYLILKYLDTDNLYTISYQTRDDSSDFLKNIEESKKITNIDFFHIFNVWEKIQAWFGDHATEKEGIKDILLDRVTFIWYQISSDDDPISVFTRLNVGKIPLTDAELIKALFLNSSNFISSNLGNRQSEIATQWDEIEFSLQNDEFWLFLHESEYTKPTRIDYIFDLIVDADNAFLSIPGKGKKDHKNIKQKAGNDEHRTFRYFYELFSINSDTDVILYWKEVYNIFRIFQEWYQDYKLYHYIGYLIAVSNNKKKLTTNLIKEWKGKPHTDFLGNYVKMTILKELEKIKKGLLDLDNYEYEKDVGNEEGKKYISKTECKPILLLHNIETIIRQNEALVSKEEYNLPLFSKFPFHLFKREKWDVEHIRPNAGDYLDKPEARDLFLKTARGYTSDDIQKKINAYLEKEEKTISDFDLLYSDICSSGDALRDEEKDKIWNYVLLDSSTNREYKNFIYPIKRAFIIGKEKGVKIKISESGELYEGENDEIAFVPICTSKVFSKSYTKIPRTMAVWTTEDAQDYLSDLKDKLKDYIDAL